MVVARQDCVHRHLRRSILRLLAFLAVSGCGGNDGGGGQGNPDAGGGNLLSVGGSYPTHATLLPGSTCADAAVQDATTTVTHAPGGTSAGNFQTTPTTVQVNPASFRLTISGHFTLSGLEATVLVEQLAPTSCSYSVQWTATKSGSPNVIPG